MKDGARLFAYTTWVVMISLAIIIFSNPFLVYIDDPGWVGLAALLALGLIYLNFSFYVSRRYIRKVLGETVIHFVLALLIYLPPALWIFLISEETEGSTRILLLVVLAFSALLGAVYGYRSGKRQQAEHFDRLQRKGLDNPDDN